MKTLSKWISGASFHIGMSVPDVEVAREFYVGLLGFEEVWAKTDIDMAAVTGIPGLREKTLVQLLVPGGSRIELQEFDPPGRIAERPITDSGLNHLSFGVEDIYAEYERLKAAGVKFNSEVLDLDFGPGEILTGWSVVYFEDPWGMTLESAGTDPWIRRRRRRRRTATRVGRGQLAYVDERRDPLYCEVTGTGPAVLFTHGFGAHLGDVRAPAGCPGCHSHRGHMGHARAW